MSEQTIRDPRAVRIRRALISVTNKNGLEDFVRSLKRFDVEIISTGGTAKTISDAGIPVRDVSDYTGFPEIMGGRVKTLHPKIHGGLLALRDDDSHKKAMELHAIEPIDLLVVNLYPFAESIDAGAEYGECIDNIDIGGPAMIRAAAKNHAYTTVVTDIQDYKMVMEDMAANDGCTTYSLRKQLAANAYSMTATYDSNVAGWFASRNSRDEFPRRISFSGSWQKTLRYGENPHQKAALYKVDGRSRPGPANASQIQGKEMSYNNFCDTDAACELVAEFEEPSVAIIKHANPCGVATGESILQAYRKALKCDPVSAFGGIIAVNRTLEADTAEEITLKFVEVIVAPSITGEAIEILKNKPAIRVLTTGEMPDPGERRRLVKRIAGGLLVQDSDFGLVSEKNLKVVTEREPTKQELADMLFGFRVCKHVKSNAIVYAKDLATVGVGAGQMSRVDSCLIAARKAKDSAIEAGENAPLTKNSVVASDAFFPFPDGLLAAVDAGATAVIQPGGSRRDEEVIKAANERGIAMVFTGMRHFRH